MNERMSRVSMEVPLWCPRVVVVLILALSLSQIILTSGCDGVFHLLCFRFRSQA